MNRVAAQNARDRKKVYVEDLEKRVAMLEDKVYQYSHFLLPLSCNIVNP